MSDQTLFQNKIEMSTVEVTLFASVSAYRHEKIHFVHPEAHIAHNSVFSFKKISYVSLLRGSSKPLSAGPSQQRTD